MADRYWVGGNGNWSNADTTHWSATSGGAAGASVPTASDDVHFDTNSTNSVVTLSGGGLLCNNLICEGTFSGRFTGSGTMTVSGNITFLATMGTNTHSGAWTLNATTAKQITPAGKTFGPLVLDGVGGSWTLQGALTIAGALTVTNGAFISNSHAVSMAALASNNTNARTINVSGSALTIGSNSTLVQLGATATNLMWLATGTTWSFTTASTTNHSVNLGGMTLDFGSRITIAGTGSGTLTFAFGSFLVDQFFINRPLAVTVQFNSFSTFTFRHATVPLSVNGNDFRQHTLASTSSGQASILLATVLNPVELQQVKIRDLTADPAGRWIVRGLPASVADLGGNTGFVFSSRLVAAARTVVDRSYRAAVMNLTPLAYWRLDEASGDFADTSGNGHTMTSGIVAPNYKLTSLLTNPEGFAAGVGVAAQLGSIPDNVPLSITGVMTLEAWIKRPNTSVGTYGIISKGNLSGGTTNLSYSLFIDGNNALTLRVSGNGSSIVGVSTPNNALNDTNIHHVAAVYIPSVAIELYVDGNRMGRTTSSVPASLFDSGASFRTGAGATNADAPTIPFTNGTLDEIAVYTKALTQVQLQNHFFIGKFTRAAAAARTLAG